MLLDLRGVVLEGGEALCVAADAHVGGHQVWQGPEGVVEAINVIYIQQETGIRKSPTPEHSGEESRNLNKGELKG